MATARIAIRLKGLQSATGLTAKLFAHTKAQNAAALATIATVTADTTDPSLYWMSLNATGLGGVIYHLAVYYSSGDDAGGGYVYLTDTEDVHEVQDSPAAAQADATVVQTTATGTGPYVVTITVQNSGAAAVAGALVRLSRTGQARQAYTNASGQVVLGCAAATWTVAIEAAGYSFTPTTLSVSGTTSQTYTLTAADLPEPAAPSFAAGYLDCYANGVLTAGVVVTAQIQQGAGAGGKAYDAAYETFTSNGSGRATKTTFIRGATYRIKVGDGAWHRLVVPDAGSFAIDELIGAF